MTAMQLCQLTLMTDKSTKTGALSLLLSLEFLSQTFTMVAKMNDALASYIETALWSTYDYADDSGGEPLDASYTADDLAPETLKQMRKDVDAFFEQAADIIAAMGDHECRGRPVGDIQIAHDFWLTRNRHGAGFWDGDYPDPEAKQLTDLARAFGEVDLYIGEDGRIYQS